MEVVEEGFPSSEFKDLPSGDIFVLHGIPYMKVNAHNNETANVCNLYTGMLGIIPSYTQVVPRKTRLLLR